MMLKYYAIYKPFNVLSQFTPEHGNLCLSDCFNVEKDVYPIGRLDKDSEGLLILTNDKKLNSIALSPKQHVEKTYWVQIDGKITTEALGNLKQGVIIKHNNQYVKTLPAKVRKITPLDIPERNPPVRFRKNIPTEWIEIKINEGKNRQVRKMTAAVGFPTLRLIRVAFGKIELPNFVPASIKEFSQNEIYSKLH
jgi:23S rRNA pseudouridine2457 synthase